MARSKPDIPQRPVPGIHRPRPQPVQLPDAIVQVAVALRDELHHIAQSLQSPGSGSTGVTTEQFNQGIQTILAAIKSGSEVSVADQSLLDGLEKRGADLATKAEALDAEVS